MSKAREVSVNSIFPVLLQFVAKRNVPVLLVVVRIVNALHENFVVIYLICQRLFSSALILAASIVLSRIASR